MKCKYVKVNNKYYFIEDETDNYHVVDTHYNRKARDKDTAEVVTIEYPEIGTIVYLEDFNQVAQIIEIDYLDAGCPLLIDSNEYASLDAVQIIDEKTTDWVIYQDKPHYVQGILHGQYILKHVENFVDASEVKPVDAPTFKPGETVVLFKTIQHETGKIIEKHNENYIVEINSNRYGYSPFDLVKLEY